MHVRARTYLVGQHYYSVTDVLVVIGGSDPLVIHDIHVNLWVEGGPQYPLSAATLDHEAAPSEVEALIYQVPRRGLRRDDR